MGHSLVSAGQNSEQKAREAPAQQRCGHGAAGGSHPLAPGGVAGRASMGDRGPPQAHPRDSPSTGRRAGPHTPEFPSCPRSKEKAEGSVLLPATPSRRSGWRSRVSAPGQPPHPCPAPAGRRAPGTNPGPQRCPAPHTRGSVCLQPLGTQTQPPERVKLPW